MPFDINPPGTPPVYDPRGIDGGSAMSAPPPVPWDDLDGSDAAGTSGTPLFDGGNAWMGVTPWS